MNSPRHFLSASTNPMPHRRLCTLALTLAMGLLFIVGAWAQGQAPVPDALITVGTTTTDGQNRRWGYVLWNPATEAITAGKRYGVYLKPGGPDDATAFVRQSVIQEERDATVLSALVDRSGFLGANLAELDATLLSMVTREGITAPPVGPAAKLALLMNRPAGEMNIRSQLRILSLGQPSVGFSLGSAWAGIIPSGQVTLEIRELDPVQLTDVAIVGRITLAAGVPAPLPPPGAPKQVWTPPSAVEISSRDHLNIKLRWGNPPELARVSLLSRGYHV